MNLNHTFNWEKEITQFDIVSENTTIWCRVSIMSGPAGSHFCNLIDIGKHLAILGAGKKRS